MSKVFSKTTIKAEDTLKGVKEKSISLVSRYTIGSNTCLSVLKDGNIVVKNFDLDQEWEAEEYYLKCVAWARQGSL